MSEQKREILIGSILGALEEDEILRVERELKQSESLRNEWSALRKELEPLRLVDAPSEPPFGLASRTTRNIWDILDKNPGKEAKLFENANCLNSIPDVFCDDKSFGHKPEPASKEKVRAYSPEKTKSPQYKPWRLPDLFVSLSVGFLIALIVFPLVHHLKNRATDIISSNEIRKFEGKLGLYPENAFAQDETLNGNFWRVGAPEFEHVNLEEASRVLSPSTNFSGLQLTSSTPNLFAVSPKAVSVENLENKFADLDGLKDDLSDPNAKKTIYDFDIDSDDDVLDDLLHDPFYLGRSHTVFFVQSSPQLPGGATFLHSSGTQNVLFRDGHVFFRLVPSNALQPPPQPSATLENMENSKFPFNFESTPLSKNVETGDNN